MKVKLKDRVANLYHKQQGIPRAGHVLNQPVPISEAMQDSIHSGWLLKVGFSVRTWKKRFFILTNTALFYYKSDKQNQRQQGEILVSHITNVIEEKEGQQMRPFSISITTSDRIFRVVASDEDDARKWMEALTSPKMAMKVARTRSALKVDIDPESFPPNSSEAQSIATEIANMKSNLLDSFNEGSQSIQKQMSILQDRYDTFEREYGYIKQVQDLGKDIKECLDTTTTRLKALQAEEEAIFQANKIRSKANWVRDAIDVGDPEQLSRHIQEMKSAYYPFKQKYGSGIMVPAVSNMIVEFEELLKRADTALNQIDANLDKLDGLDIIIGKITWLSDAVERGTAQDLQKHMQEMREILTSYTTKHGEDPNALPITNEAQELVVKAEIKLVKLRREAGEQTDSEPTPADKVDSPATLSSSARSASQASLAAALNNSQVFSPNINMYVRPAKRREDSAEEAGKNILGTDVYCTLKQTGKAGRKQKYVICLTCENYDSSICLNCRDVCHAGHDVTYEREAETACGCGMGAFPTPCACLISEVTKKSPQEIEEIHKQVVENRKSRMVTSIINEISIFPNPNPPAAWNDLTRDPCGLIFAHTSKKDQGFTSELHKKMNMRVVFAKHAILKGMGEEVLQESFTDSEPIYGRVYLPAAPARIPVSEFPGEDIGYSKVSCFTGIVLYIDGQLWLPPSVSSNIPLSPRRKFSVQGIPSPILTPVRRTQTHGHSRSNSSVGVVNVVLPPAPTLASSFHSPSLTAAVPRKNTHARRDSVNNRLSRRLSTNNLLSLVHNTPPNPDSNTFRNSTSISHAIANSLSGGTITSPLYASAQSLPRVNSHTRGHTRTSSITHSLPIGPTVGGTAGLGLSLSTSANFVGSPTLLGPELGLNVTVTPAVEVAIPATNGISPSSLPNHFFELSMVSGEPQWEWTTYRLMLQPSPNDPDSKIYQTQISNWQKAVLDMTPGTHRIRFEVALGPNPPLRYCVAYGEYDYTVTEAHQNKIKQAEQEAQRALVVKEWKDKYTYGTIESEVAGKWVYSMDGSLKCCDGPYVGAEYMWKGDKLEKKTDGLECVFECCWHPNKHPPELDVHFIPDLETCGFTLTHPFVSLILTTSGVTVTGSVPPPLVTLIAELRFIDREYRQSRAEWESKMAQKKKFEEVKSRVNGKDCPNCKTAANWLICTKCFVDFCGCYTAIDPHCPVCNCIDDLASFDESFPP